MIGIINGQPVQVPDDERITRELSDARDVVNAFLRFVSTNSELRHKVDEQYRTGALSQTDGFDWFRDPEVR